VAWAWRAGFPHGAGAAPKESPPDSGAMPARDREDDLRRLCRRDVAEDAVKIAKRRLVVEHKGLCTKGAENRGQAIGGAGDGV
jgi:hypothetical protein